MAAKLKMPRSNQKKNMFGSIELTHPERVLYTDQGITKLDLANYYTEIADWILPHLVDRPLSVVRCPGGTTGPCFYQKHPPEGLSEVVERIPIREKDEFDTYVVVRNIEGVIALVQFGALELHPWGSKADNIERPDRIVFDLDPDVNLPWKRVAEAALLLRELLAELGLRSFVKTTGGNGLHIVLPVVRKHNWQEVKQFTKTVAEAMAALQPQRYVANMSKAARKGKIFVDYLRNERGATAVAPYSTRARNGAPVSTPIDWEELPHLSGADDFDIRAVLARLRKLRRDPWAEITGLRQGITASARKKLGIR